MRIALALVAFAACAVAHAQRIDGSTSTARPGYRERDDRDERRTPEPRPGAKANKKADGTKTAPITVVRPVERDEWKERERRRREQNQWKQPAKTMDGPAPLISVKPTPNGPPSPAEQMQRRMAEEQRHQRGEPAAVAGSFRCNAFPVCDRSTGSYASCRGVEHVYSARSWRDARQQVARDCAAANSPDPCNCATQCSRVAQCGPV